VILPDGTKVNHTLVKDGWCWWYRKYAEGDTVLEGLEKDAREAKNGLWVNPAPVPPWVYRKASREEWRHSNRLKDAIVVSSCRIYGLGASIFWELDETNHGTALVVAPSLVG
jgi:hypothetical protein